MFGPRSVAVCGVALLLVLSGCGGLLGGDGDGPGAESPTPTGPASQVADEDLPDGLDTTVRDNATTVVLADATALLAAHESGVAETGSRTRFVSNNSIPGAGNATIVTNRGADGTFGLEYTTSTQRGTLALDIYSNGTVTHQRQSAATVTVYSMFVSGFYRNQLNSTSSLSQYVRLGDYELTDVGNDGTRLTMTATTLGNYSDPALPDPSNVSSFDAEFVVDLEGRIHSLSAELVLNGSQGEVTSTVEYDLEEESLETVEEPAWTGTAREQSTFARLSVSVEGDAIVIDHEGGDAVPQGAIVSVGATSGDAESFTVQLPEALESGETAYVYRASGEERGSVSVGSQPSGDLASLPSSMQVSVIGPNRRTTIAVTEVSSEDDEE